VINVQPALSQVLVKKAADGTETYYVHGLGLIGQEQNGEYLSYHFDYRGSTVALTDETGSVVERYLYSPYGLLLNGDASITPFLFNGMYGVMTDDNGLYYMRARYYSPEIRRFVNQDILLGDIFDGQTLNRYAFVTGKPVSFVDPFGLNSENADSWLNTTVNITITALEIFDTASDIVYGCSVVASGGSALAAFPVRLTKKEGIAILIKFLKNYLVQHKFSISQEQLGKKIGRHIREWGLDPSVDQDRFVSIINDIVREADQMVLGDFMGQGPGGSRGPALFFIKGNDVVITDLNGKFVTIMKDGINNTSVKTALDKILK
jgi:RHS repeat-associated protein